MEYICRILHIPIICSAMQSTRLISFSQLENKPFTIYAHNLFLQINCSLIYSDYHFILVQTCKHEHEHENGHNEHSLNTFAKTTDNREYSNHFHQAKQHEHHFIARKMFVNLFLKLS